MRTIDFGERYRRTYREMLDCIHDRLPSLACRAFWPIAGRDYRAQEERLAFVGQSVGDWGKLNGQCPNADTYRAWFSPTRPYILSGIENYSMPEDEPESCPLAWFNDIRGHFHHAVRALCREKAGWDSQMAWSNLYKVAQDPRGRGNPCDPLCDVQFEHARKLFRIELERLQPTCTFVLAGRIWYEPFFEPSERVLARARARDVAAFRTHDKHLVVVAPHPRSWCLRGLTLDSLSSEIGDAIAAVAETAAERSLAARLTLSRSDEHAPDRPRT